MRCVVVGDIETGRTCGCGDCEDCHAYKLHMAERDTRARQVKHTIVPMHKQGYMAFSVEAARDVVKQLNPKRCA